MTPGAPGNAADPGNPVILENAEASGDGGIPGTASTPRTAGTSAGAGVPAPAPTLSERQHRWSLQARLMVTVIGFVALTLTIIAVAISATLGGLLQSNMNGALKATAEDSARSLILNHLPGKSEQVTAAQVLSSAQTPRTTVLVLRSPEGITTGAYVDEGVHELSQAQIAQIVSALAPGGSEREHTRTVSIDDLGSYNVQAYPVPGVGLFSGNEEWLEVVGLPTDTIGARMLLITGAITAAGMVLLAAAIAVVIRTSLRPLRAVADTATRVAGMPMAEGKVTITERVPAEEGDERTEVGRVGHALNTLLDHVGASLLERQRNEERMRQFVADASHELRTPLASIRGYSELTLRGLSSGRGSESDTRTALERIQAQSIRMTTLVDDLLLLARLDEGQELVFGAVDLTRLTVEAVADARPAGPEHAWVLDVDQEPLIVAGDATRLHQVTANLLANARTHTPPGTTVTVGLRREGEHTALVQIHDNGPGIDPAVAAELFERFSRADRSRARKTGGTGLGMSIARAIVHAHGGTLTVQSEPGSTTFQVRLPTRPAAEPGRRQ